MIKMKLNLLLAQNGLKQNDLANNLNIPKNTVSKYVNNTFSMINKDHLEAMCKYFNCQIQDILEYKDETNYKLGSGLTTTIKETPVTYKDAYGHKSQKELFYKYAETHIGQWTPEDIRKYSLFLCEDDDKLNFLEAIAMLQRVNEQYKK